MKRIALLLALIFATPALAEIDFQGFVDETFIEGNRVYILPWTRVEQMMTQDFGRRPGCAIRLHLSNDDLDELGWCSGSGDFRNLFGLRCNDEDPMVRRTAERAYDNLRIAHIKRWNVRVSIDSRTYLSRHDGERICMIRRVWLHHKQ